MHLAQLKARRTAWLRKELGHERSEGIAGHPVAQRHGDALRSARHHRQRQLTGASDVEKVVVHINVRDIAMLVLRACEMHEMRLRKRAHVVLQQQIIERRHQHTRTHEAKGPKDMPRADHASPPIHAASRALPHNKLVRLAVIKHHPALIALEMRVSVQHVHFPQPLACRHIGGAHATRRGRHHHTVPLRIQPDAPRTLVREPPSRRQQLVHVVAWRGTGSISAPTHVVAPLPLAQLIKRGGDARRRATAAPCGCEIVGSLAPSLDLRPAPPQCVFARDPVPF